MGANATSELSTKATLEANIKTLNQQLDDARADLLKHTQELADLKATTTNLDSLVKALDAQRL